MTTKKPFNSPETRAALALVKSHVASIVPASYFDRTALRLLGMAHDVADEHIEALRIEFTGLLRRDNANISDTWTNAFSIAFATMISDRVRELQSAESGNA